MGSLNEMRPRSKGSWALAAALAGALALVMLAGCESGKSSTTSSNRSDADRSEADGDSNRRTTKPWTEGEPGDGPQPLQIIDTSDMNKVAGVKERRGVKPAGDVLYSLYDVGHSQKSGISRTIIHVFPESSTKYRKLANNPDGWIPKRIPDEDMHTMIEGAEKDKFATLLRPMTQAKLEAEFASGNSVITLERNGNLLGAVQPRLKTGDSEESIKRFQGMKALFMAISRAYITPSVSGGTGPAAEFKQPARRP